MASGGEVEARWWRYIQDNWNKMQLHDADKIVLGALLTELGYGKECGGIEKDVMKAEQLLSDEEFEVYTHFRDKHSS